MAREELDEKLDAAFALHDRWAGAVVRVSERVYWEAEGRQMWTRYPLSYMTMPLHGIWLNMCGGTIGFEFVDGNSRAEFGVLLNQIVSIEFPTGDRVEFVERLGPGTCRRLTVERSPGASRS